MILKTIRVQNYKSIDDSGEFTVDQMTCLVGKNEAGKSALLQALYKLNPVIPEDYGFNYVEEYPRRRVIDYEQHDSRDPNDDINNVVTSVWELLEADRDTLADLIGPEALTSGVVTIRMGYWDNERHWEFAGLDESAVVKHYLANAGLYAEELKLLEGSATIYELSVRLSEAPTASDRLADLVAQLEEDFPKGDVNAAATKLLEHRLPKFVYFANYQAMPGQVSMEQLVSRKQKEALTFGDRVFMALLSLAGTTPETIQQTGRFEAFIARLEIVSLRISREIFEYWSQNKHLEVEFRLDVGRPQDPAPYNTGNVFRTRIRNKRHGVTVSFSERSTGFVWFFRF